MSRHDSPTPTSVPTTTAGATGAAGTPPVRVRVVARTLPAEPHGAELPVMTTDTAEPVGPVPGRPLDPAHDGERVVVSTVLTREESGALQVVLTGDVDLALAGELALVQEQVLEHCATRPGPRVHVDVRGVTAVDASAVRFLERLRRAAADAGGSCTTAPARPGVQRVLDLARPVAEGELAAS
ncbi:STAS domain-containing protein [Kineococcus arenarius]|uniref:STAS domain-containing protein n=1 Tax=unclassified Kineococcus TaxID=2621656 RepID=UPI003D7D0D4B